VHHRRERKQPRGQENQAEPLRLQHLRTFGGQRQTWCHGDDEHLIYVASLGSVNKQTASLALGALLATPPSRVKTSFLPRQHSRRECLFPGRSLAIGPKDRK
jgi:hypothetical protein